MKKKYTYKNGVIYIDIPTDAQIKLIQKESKCFAKRIIFLKEISKNGDSDTTRIVR